MAKDLVSTSVEQWCSALKIYAATWADADLVDRPGIRTFWADSAFSLWNGLLLDERMPTQTRLRSRIADAAAYMHEKKATGLLYTCEDFVPRVELDSLMTESGFKPAIRLRGMVANLPLGPRQSVPGLQIVRVHDRKTATDFSEVISETYSIPLDVCGAEFVDKAFWSDDAYAFVSYYQDEPASVSSIIVVNDLLYVGLVATRPSFQKKGLSSATNFHMLQHVREATDIKRSALHATDQGFPAYLKLGFRPVTEIVGFGLVRQP